MTNIPEPVAALTGRGPTPRRRPGQVEFTVLVAMLFAMTAFSIDAMLAALPRIAQELTPDAPNRAQLIITSFVLGMGLGTFVSGPIADAIGRKRTIIGGIILYMAGAALAAAAQSLELVLAARLIQGLGIAGPRIATLALVRDLYAGREMARIVSFAMMIFTLVPAIAPAIGALIIAGFGWRAIFAAFILFAGSCAVWLALRQQETLPAAARIPLRAAPILSALREILGHRVIVTVMAVQTLVFGMLFGTLSSAQQIIGEAFGRQAEFPFWFAVVAVIGGSASLVNAALVVRLGMRFLVSAVLGAQTVVSAAMAIVLLTGALPESLAFGAFIAWMGSVFFLVGLTLGNLSALSLEPVGHIAGTAASLTTALATVGAVALAVPVGQAYDGTPLPLVVSVAVMCALGFAVIQTLRHRPDA